MAPRRNRKALVKPFALVAAAGLLFTAAATFSGAEWAVPSAGDPAPTDHAPPPPRVRHLPTPDPLYGIYMTQCVAGTPSFRDSLVKLIDDTKLNAVVIDVKDFSGTIGFPTEDPRFEEASLAACPAADMEAFLKTLHEKDIYAIARITVFQDPFYTKVHPEQAVQSVARPGEPWKDYKGLSFVDVSSREFWDYIAVLSKEAYAIGFDELNYDYIRYPSDGPMKDANYVNDDKAETLERFFAYLHNEVSPTGAKMSADLFGYTTVLSGDLGIGQVLERALPYFDYLAPMVYPSHYNKGFAGLADPNSDPYLVVHTSLLGAIARARATTTPVAGARETLIASTSPPLYEKRFYPATVIRPWLQSFDYPIAYTPEMVDAQISATEDAGLSSWMFWDATNQYRSLKAVLSE